LLSQKYANCAAGYPILPGQGYASPVVSGGASGSARGDVNGDGAGDATVFATLADGSAETRVYSSKGVRVPLTGSVAIRPGTTRISCLDWDGDGDDDIVYASTSAGGGIELLKLTADGSKPQWVAPGYPQMITGSMLPATNFQLA